MELAVGRTWEMKTGQKKTLSPTNRGAFTRVMTGFSRNPKGHHDYKWRKDLQMEDMKRSD